ncbi:unnamed protein product [Toxocara canis]|uniref:Restriction endonuclease n=1 Tax=Toxocara canis TaxID=6265 RepID=A0A183V7W2_TOXCA|nr:unnamed protein product [Toxocara canis]
MACNMHNSGSSTMDTADMTADVTTSMPNMDNMITSMPNMASMTTSMPPMMESQMSNMKPLRSIRSTLNDRR